MKTVFKEWLRDKRACAMLLTFFFINAIYMAINARVVILISNTISDLANYKYHLTILMVVCMIQMFFSTIIATTRPLAIGHCFTTLNNRYADKVIDADVDMFTKYSCSHINTVSEFVGRVTNAGSNFIRFLLNIVNVVVLLVNIYLVGGNLIFPVMIIYAIGACAGKIIFKHLEEYDKKAHEAKRQRNQQIENVVNGFAEVRSFNTQEWHRNIIKEYNRGIFQSRVKKTKIQRIMYFSFEGIDTLGLFAVVIYSVQKLATGEITQAAAMSLIMLVFRIIDPLLGVVDFMDSISEDISMASQYEELMNYINKTKNGSMTMTSFEDKIELENVSFSYDGESEVIKNINMTFPKGKKIGICGISGAGKSTIFKLLNKFYNCSGGNIYVDGLNINAISRDSYRKHVAAVFQDNTVFPGTIMQNITYGNFSALEFEVIMACKKAHIYDFIMGLPDKFETQVGPRGLTLSGGQKQRIALARLFLSNPEIILLDEATSALDNESETFIQDAIDSLKDKTIVTIAHRLSTIRNSDIIYVMGSNGVLEQGTHDELMELKGAYYAMNK